MVVYYGDVFVGEFFFNFHVFASYAAILSMYHCKVPIERVQLHRINSIYPEKTSRKNSRSHLHLFSMSPSAAPREAAIAVRRCDPDHIDDIENFRQMTRAYLQWLQEDLSFQSIELELASLPGSYHPNAGGCMLLAYDSHDNDDNSTRCIGAVALRPLVGNHLPHLTSIAHPHPHPQPPALSPTHVCEMKRLFVLPTHHGKGAGTQLTIAITEAAKAMGYRAIVLDTLDRLEAANRVYKAQGFELCERYNDCPLPGVLYFIKLLT